MIRRETDKNSAQVGTSGELGVQPNVGADPHACVPGPDVMLGLWAAWMDQISASPPASGDRGNSWWQMMADNPGVRQLAGGVRQLQESLSKDPMLRSIDEAWNANPLREVVPIDWAEIARALRTVWLRSLAKPAAVVAVMELNQNLWRSALDAWQEAGQRWSGASGAPLAKGPTSASADKRFAAPEWHSNPVYRTLKEVYLLASDWLLKQGTRTTWTRLSGSASTSTFASSWMR